MEIKSENPFLKSWVRGAIIGAGAFATVSLAISKSDGELLAVKSMETDSENEYSILNSLDSPYIVKCLGKDYTVENGVGVHNLLMEYMPGGSVADLITKFGGQLEESVIRGCTRGILRGLDYIHRRGVVHCDIKGKNVLVGADGAVKLGDFGSAKNTEDKGSNLKNLRGTLLWMAPEVVNRVEQGPASDIWSVGCTVVEMATGRPPWSNVSNPIAGMYRIGCTEQLPELPPCLSPQGRDFVEKCLKRDPKQRWTAAQLLNHPFLNCCSASEAKRGPLSPTSTLDFCGPDWGNTCSSTLSRTVPILSLDIARRSPRDRIAALATGCKKPDWCASPPSGEWIVVRSNSPLSNNLLPSTNNYRKGEILSQSASVISGLDASASGEQRQHGCKLASRPSRAPLIDQVQEIYENSSEHISGDHYHDDIHGRALVEQIFCVCAAQGGNLFRYCDVSEGQLRPVGQQYISPTSNGPCNTIPLIIPIHLIWLHFWLSMFVLFSLYLPKSVSVSPLYYHKAAQKWISRGDT